MTRVCCALVLLVACATAQSIEGTVVNSVTGAGIAGLKVNAQQGSITNSATTDLRGQFSFEGLKEGVWAVNCNAADYAFAGRPKQVQVTAGSPVKVELRMTPSPRISGRVVDGNGKPAPNATIQLIAPASFYTGKADAEGKFGLHVMLPPGDYTLSATPPPGMKPPDPEPEGGRILGWARTYYSATTVREGAARIPLKPGSEFTELEVKLMAVPAHAIRGVCLMPDGSPAAKVTLELGEGAPFPVAQTIQTDSEGAFEFPAVVDGEWNLSARQNELRAGEWVEVRGHDIERLTLRLSSLFTITGKVVMEVPQGMPSPRTPVVHLQPHLSHTMLEVGTGASGITAKNGADGSFTLDEVYPGRYSIHAPANVGAYYLDAVSLGGAEVLTPEVEIDAPSSIAVVYKTNGGGIRGAVKDCGDGSVWLVPQEESLRSAMSRFIPCLAEGHYQFNAVRPGEYYVFASGGQFSRGWLFGIFEQAELNQADKVTFRPGETTTLDLKIK